MIKYIGSVGTFIRLNDNDNKTYQLLNVYSSSAAQLSLFSAEINNSTGLVSFDSASTLFYVNGVSASIVPNQQWSHITFSFEDKLATYDTNNFLIRFGDSASSNFNIQNLYILESSLSSSAVGYLHKEFTGAGSQVVRVNDSASYSINFIDSIETNYTSSSITSVYQPLKGQLRFDKNVAAATDLSLTKFISASTMINDDLYVDGHNVSENDFILSFEDNIVYRLTASSYLTTSSNSIGDFIRISFGRTYKDNHYLYASGSYTLTPVRLKIDSYQVVSDTNNL